MQVAAAAAVSRGEARENCGRCICSDIALLGVAAVAAWPHAGKEKRRIFFDITWFTASAHGPGARAARITRISESKPLIKFNKLVCGGGREAIIPNKC